MLRIQHVEHFWDYVPNIGVTPRKHLKKVDVACLILERDDGIMDSLVDFQSFVIFLGAMK